MEAMETQAAKLGRQTFHQADLVNAVTIHIVPIPTVKILPLDAMGITTINLLEIVTHTTVDTRYFCFLLILVQIPSKCS